jgi:DNA/RNA-binding domain of Phe-tRNA-synthetase-like protein
MHFFHSPSLWSAFPALQAGVMHVREVHGVPDFEDLAIAHIEAAKSRLDGGNDAQARAPLPEGQWPEIQAWRRVYSEMGLQPTQVRCAAEALLRRLRQDGQLPKVNPLVDLCNAVSVHAAAPVAIFDCAQVAWPLCVARARGDEEFLAFSGESEHPAEGEVVFVDAARRAHARKWAHRQSCFSAVSSSTESVLIVVEAFHEGAAATVADALRWLDDAFRRLPGCTTRSRSLSASNPDFLNP